MFLVSERGSSRGTPGGNSNGGKLRDKTAYPRYRALTDAEIEKAVAADPSTFIPDAAWWKRALFTKPRTH